MIQDVLSRLDKVDKRRGYWMARCPAHKDDKPSLKVHEREDGKVCMTCFGGCSIEAICGAIGLKVSELYAQKLETEKPERWCFKVDGKSEFKEVAAKYDYTDENGNVLYQVVRSKDKDFAVRRPCTGGYSPGQGDRKVLYRLPHVLKALEENRVIWIVEGEKDVWALEAVGEVATTNSGGASNFPADASKIFKGARVNIVQDKDEAGLKRTASLVKVLEQAKYIKVLEAKHGKDSYDHLTKGGTLKDFVRRQDLEPEKQNAVVFMADVEAKTPRFLWYPYLPIGVMSIVDGDSDVGKSFMTCALAAGLSLGKLPFQDPSEPMATIFFGSEDDASTYRSRLEIFGADMDKIAFVPEPFGLDANGMTFIRDVMTMVEERCGKIGMCVMDPLSDYVSHTMKNGRPVDWNRSIDVRPCLTLLANLAMEKDVAWLNVRHYTKTGATGQIDTKHAGEGSTAIRAKHRSQMVVVWDGEVPHRRVVKHDKHNYSQRGQAFGYELVGRGRDNQPDFFWIESVDEENAGMHRAVKGKKKPTTSPRDWLIQTLTEDGGQRSQDIMAKAKQAGYSQDDVWKERDVARISKVNEDWVWTYKDPFEDEE